MSMERIYPDMLADDETTGSETLELHLERYHFAGKHLIPGNTADVACGVGYGSHLLATQYHAGIEGIFAADIDERAIGFARQRYPHPLIRFIQADAYTFDAAQPLHNIVSLETIEHLKHPRRFIANAARQLVAGGRFIASAPVTPSMDANPYHLQDFTVRSFRQLFFQAGFKEIDSFTQVQRYNPFPLLGKKEKRSQDLRGNLLRYYIDHPGKFFLRIGSVLKDGFSNKYLVGVFEKL